MLVAHIGILQLFASRTLLVRNKWLDRLSRILLQQSHN